MTQNNGYLTRKTTYVSEERHKHVIDEIKNKKQNKNYCKLFYVNMKNDIKIT